ncbi:MAG: ORF6N domain-containing protein [Hafnia alvei]|uniref:Phage anti-repressor protein n=2 Tax=Hafnia alvei TaxID=569 RepID=A0A377PFX1_HAFAL|nr:ORF6N domain-containing protein [Hafnia alvei]KFC88048.1 phage antirepressor protein [Hafnia alvei ATCC 13337]RLR08367.1 ORF6N domain-containing protein [Hafnia alvei ATCC 13337]WQD26358.1 ORF6N domain-containing protein [Hafnia alvei]STQ79195.1 Phage anti-repressor protein [Hafnia alvei]
MAKKTELVAVEAKDLKVIEYRNQRVVSNEQMASGYGTDPIRIRQNYHENKDRFVEGKHYFKVVGAELNNLRVAFNYLQISSKTRSLMLWTERGAANHAKMLETDQAWEYYNDLTEFYFTQRDAKALPAPVELSTLEIIQLALESEKGRLAEKERADHAERTKGQISRKREASALGKLSAKSRRCKELEERLGEGVKHAAIKKVEKATGVKETYKFVPLRKWCRDNGMDAKDVVDDRWGSVKAWPAQAWLAVYNIDLNVLFGGNL